MATLNTATSIVDYLKSTNQSSDFESRKRLYDQTGLSTALGDFRGTAEQNTTLLKRLTAGQPQLQTQTFTPNTPFTPANVINETTPGSLPQSVIDLARQETGGAQEEFNTTASQIARDLAATELRGAEGLQRNVGALQREATADISGLQQQGEKQIKQTGEQAAGFGGAFSGVTKKTQADIALQVASKQQEVKAKLGDQLYNQFSEFEQQFGTDFLKSLSIPEAEEFVKLPVPIRSKVAMDAQKVLDAAADKAQKAATKTLESLGYVILADGTIFQKPSEARAESREERALRGEERADVRLGLSEASGQRAEEANRRAEEAARRGEAAGVRAERRLELAEERAKGRSLSDEEFRIAIRNAQAEGLSLQQVLDNIETDTNIANKDRGRLIANEIIGTSVPTSQPEVRKSFFQRLFGFF